MTTTAAKRDRRKGCGRSNFNTYPSHAVAMLKRLNEQRTSGTLCDITVHVEYDQFRAHRCMLAASCETFKQLIDKDPRNDLNMTSNIKSNAFIVILDYIYTGSVTLKEDCVQNVLYAAKYFNLPDVEKSCERFLNQLYSFWNRNKTLNECEVFESKLSYSVIATSTNNVKFKSNMTFGNSSTSSINCGNLSTLVDNSCRETKTNSVRVGLNEIKPLIEPKIEVEEESEIVLHPELEDVCAYVDADKTYNDCFKHREISAISVQTLNENTSDDFLLESVLTQVNVNQDSFITILFDESDRSNIFVKREIISPPLDNSQQTPLVNIQQTCQTSVKKTSAQRGKDGVQKRIKTSSVEIGKERIRERTNVFSAVKRDNKRVRKHIKNPVIFLDDDSADTVVFGTGIDDDDDNLNIVVPLNGFTKIEQPLPNSSDKSNTCNNHVKNVLKRRERKESKLAKKIKYLQSDSIPLTQHDSPSFVCTGCNRRFVRMCDLTRHRLKLHNVDTFKCHLCDEEFTNISKFKQHSIGVHAVRQCFVCPYEGCKFKTHDNWHLKQHSLIHSDVKHFQCGTCGKSFAQSSGLAIHLRSCLKEKSYLCDFCGRKFNLPQELVTHLRVHTGERPYQCDMCSAQFTDNPNYKRHRRIHQNAFPYSCHLCEKKFRHSNSLKAHMVNH